MEERARESGSGGDNERDAKRTSLFPLLSVVSKLEVLSDWRLLSRCLGCGCYHWLRTCRGSVVGRIITILNVASAHLLRETAPVLLVPLLGRHAHNMR